MDGGEDLNSTDDAYRNVFVRQILSNWKTKIVHLEVGGSNFIKVAYHPDSWTYGEDDWKGFPIESRQEGDALLQNIKENPEIAAQRGWLPEDVSFHCSDSLGFSDSEVPSKGLDADVIFGIGRDFADKVLEGWIPSSAEEVSKLSYFLLNAPFHVGYFGNFKLILKTLTNKFDTICEDQGEDFVSLFAGCLGAAYGRVEAYLSRGQSRPEFRLSGTSYLGVLSSLPELSGYAFPSIKTAQFLSRMGLRFMRHIEARYSGYPSTRFRLNLMTSADFWHQEVLDPYSYLQYQQLVTAAIYGKGDLAKRDRNSRKVLLGSAEKRDSLTISNVFVESLNEKELELYRRQISKVSGRNSAVAHYFLALAKVIPAASFDWNARTVSTLAHSASKKVRSEVWSAALANPSFLLAAQSVFQEALPKIKDADLETLFAIFRGSPSEYAHMARTWASSILGKQLSETELRLACEFLRSKWPKSSYYAEDRQNLLLQIARITDLEPIGEWQEHFGGSEYDLESTLGFFGIEPTSKFPQGLLDVVNPNRRELILAIARKIAPALSWANKDERVRALLVMHDSTKPGVSNVFWCIVTQGLLSSKKTSSVLTKLNEADPTATGYLNGLQYAFEANDNQGLLVLLQILAGDDKSTFWRKNAVDAENIFRSSAGFAEFAWNNLSNLEPRIIELISEYSWLPPEIYRLLNPNALAKVMSAQADFLVKLISKDKSIFGNAKLVRALLCAPNSTLNDSAIAFVSDTDSFDVYWLFMLESKLPISQNAARIYLESQAGQPDFADKLLMALDSNSSTVRQIAMQIMKSIPSVSMLQQVVSKLVESRNADTWALVANNLLLLDNPDGLNEFTKNVLLSKRQGRTVKEKIKVSVERFVDDIAFAVEIDTLLRLAQGSNNKDREWALKQLALAQQPIEGVSVERTWKAVKNV
jgi:hypothetical protein